MAATIEVRDLSHTYSAGTPFQHDAVKHMSFSVEKGEFLGIIGHTGSGKSTLIQHLNGLLRPTSGEILLDGTNIWQDKKTTRESRFRVGLVFQYPEYQLFEETVYRDIAFGPKNMGLSEEEIRTRVLRAAGFAGVDESLLESRRSTSPAGRSAASPLRASSPWSRRSSFLTSRQPGWTPQAAPAFSAIFVTIRRRRTPPSSWSRIPWMRSRSWPTVCSS